MQSLKEELLIVLARVDFDRRFYALYEQLRDSETDRNWKKEEIAPVLAQTSLAFKYVNSERFFTHSEGVGSTKIDLSVKVRDSEAELLLEVSRGEEVTGGPFQLLAKEVAERREPEFTYDPPYPWLPFASLDDFRLIAQFAVAIFEELKKAFAAK